MNMKYDNTPIENYRQMLKNHEDEMMAVIGDSGFAHILACLEEGDMPSGQIDKNPG